MTQLPSLLKALRFAGLLAIVMLGLVSIIGTGGGSGGGGGYPSDYDGTTYHRDGDGDGYGNPADSIRSTSQPQGYVSDGTDCDDTDAAINRGAAEICGDDKDNNCDGQVNESCACTDADDDGYYAQSGCGTAVDCVDDNAAIHPGMAEIGGDGIDNNCDGQIDDGILCTDADGDGYYVESGCVGKQDCDDANAAINPGVADICGDAIDNDCDGQIDGRCPLLPDTGQNTCYDVAGTVILCPAEGQALYGQDACYTINPLSYVKLDDSGNELPDGDTSWVMVRDNVTGLIWEVKTDDGGIHDKDNRFTWYNAPDAFIARLNADHFGGYSDWRLPTRNELLAIVNYGTYGPAIDTRYFPNTAASYYLTSTSYGGNPGDPWLVDFLIGHVYDLYQPGSHYARAVRGEQSSPSFTDNGNGTITDNVSGLMWARLGSVTAMTWQAALAWCENLSLSGYKDWRLPTIKELESIVDSDATNPAIDSTYFPGTVLTYYWSSTVTDYYTDHAWLVDFSFGDNGHGGKSNTYYVRPVRGGQ